MKKKRLFVSHISEERSIAEQLKTALNRDFLGLLDVFVSSDTDSIAAGEEWLRSIDKGSARLRDFCHPLQSRVHSPPLDQF